MQSTFAVMLLVVFTFCLAVESVVYDVSDLFQSELVDFENDQDTEEDSENENKKEEDKPPCGFEFLMTHSSTTNWQGYKTAWNPNATIQEVLSPPPELN